MQGESEPVIRVMNRSSETYPRSHKCAVSGLPSHELRITSQRGKFFPSLPGQGSVGSSPVGEDPLGTGTPPLPVLDHEEIPPDTQPKPPWNNLRSWRPTVDGPPSSNCPLLDILAAFLHRWGTRRWCRTAERVPSQDFPPIIVSLENGNIPNLWPATAPPKGHGGHRSERACKRRD